MTPKEKAKELYNKMLQWQDNADIYIERKITSTSAKQSALIAVDEILNLDLHDVGDYRNDQASSDDFSTVTWYINYWEEVKQEIEQI